VVQGKTAQDFSYLCSKGKSAADIRKEVVLFEKVDAPIPMDAKIGEIIYYYGDDKIGTIDILATEAVEKAGLKDYFVKVLKKYFVGN
jgi:D-alanyl-D-alanine carboxypeptidase (penicillin-binding protein 5/6)